MRNGQRTVCRGWMVMVCLWLCAGLLTGCAGAGNMQTSRFDSAPLPDSRADFAQLPASGFGGTETHEILATASPENMSSFDSPGFIPNSGFDNHAFDQPARSEKPNVSEPTIASNIAPRQQVSVPILILPALPGMGITNSSVSAIVVARFLEALSLVESVNSVSRRTLDTPTSGQETVPPAPE